MEQHQKRDAGFTLIELLIAIVVVGILTAVVIVGVGALVNSGEDAACSASRDAAEAASAVHYANTNGWPADLEDMVTPGELKLPAGATAPGAGVLTYSQGTSWTLTMTVGAGGNGPTFACT